MVNDWPFLSRAQLLDVVAEAQETERAEQIGGMGDRPGVRAPGFPAADQGGAAVPLVHQRVDPHLLIAGPVAGIDARRVEQGPGHAQVAPGGPRHVQDRPADRLQGVEDVPQSGEHGGV